MFYVLPIISGDQGLWKSSNQNKIEFSQINFPFKLDWLACCKAKCWIYGRFRRTYINFCGMRCDVRRQLLSYFVLSQTRINLMSMQDTIQSMTSQSQDLSIFCMLLVAKSWNRNSKKIGDGKNLGKILHQKSLGIGLVQLWSHSRDFPPVECRYFETFPFDLYKQLYARQTG